MDRIGPFFASDGSCSAEKTADWILERNFGFRGWVHSLRRPGSRGHGEGGQRFTIRDELKDCVHIMGAEAKPIQNNFKYTYSF
jgi:hypothetical protein